MSELSPYEIGGIFGVCYLLVQGIIEIAKFAIGRRMNGKKAEQPGPECKAIFPEDQKRQLKFLHDIHDRFDDDGSPLWYVPRSWAVNQAKIIELLTTISVNQENLVKAIDKLIEKIN